MIRFINEDHIQLLARSPVPRKSKSIKATCSTEGQLSVDSDFSIKSRIHLIDFKIEDWQKDEGTILLADEISPDTCRLWDLATEEHLDKDVYRREIGDLIPVYQEVLNRLEKEYISCI
jgi:phosphoribosylaminoimidazole-succinocarboxamide synthase